MMNRLCLAILLALLFGLTPAAHAKELVQQFSGDVSADTPEFEVLAPWIVEWRITGEPNPMAAADISLMNADTGTMAGQVLRTGRASERGKLFKQSGHYYFHVKSSKMHWALHVLEVSPKEARQYESKTRKTPYS